MALGNCRVICFMRCCDSERSNAYRIAPGNSFVNSGGDSVNVTNTDEPKGYVGLSEEDALAKAKSENKPARIVECSGEALPVTMDFVVGRLNLTVNNGKVEKVEVEGE